jgi:hypothetical protein
MKDLSEHRRPRGNTPREAPFPSAFPLQTVRLIIGPLEAAGCSERTPLRWRAGFACFCEPTAQCYDRLPKGSMRTFPEWWSWDLSFTGHAELRMEQRGVTEVEVRAMLERATGFEASVVEGRFMIQTQRA